MNVNDLVPLLKKATKAIEERHIEPYAWLRDFVAGGCNGDREKFRRKFSKYYGLYTGGVTDEFRSKFFEILFFCELCNADDPYIPILTELSRIKTHKKSYMLPVSFVSKLVAIHDESRPLFDRHVSDFFGIGCPRTGDFLMRARGFVANLDVIRSRYLEWGKEGRVAEVLSEFRGRYPMLADTHDVRLCDFLVWVIGNRKLAGTAASVAWTAAPL